VFVSVCVNIC